MDTDQELKDALEAAIKTLAGRAATAGTGEAASFYAAAVKDIAEGHSRLVTPGHSH